MITKCFKKTLSGNRGVCLVVLGRGTCNQNQFNDKPQGESPLFWVGYKGKPLAYLDWSISAIRRTRKKNLKVPGTAFIGHVHTDHCWDVGNIVETLCSGLPAPTIYMPRKSLERFKAHFLYHHPENELPDGSYKFWPEHNFVPQLYPLDHGSTAALLPNTDDFFVEAQEMSHGGHPTMALNVYVPAVCGKKSQVKISYTSDTGYFPERIVPFAKDADLLVADCSVTIAKGTDPDQRHMSPYECGLIAKAANVQTLMLTHFSGVDSPAAMIADAKRSGFLGTIVVAHEGMVWFPDY